MLERNEVQLAREAAGRVVEIHRRLADWLRPGLTLAQIDTFVADRLRDLKSRSAFLNYRTGAYRPFPSHACLSVNDVIVHGTAGMSLTPIGPGDVLSIDIGVRYHGYVGDAAWTYIIAAGSDTAVRLCQCGVECIRRGVAALQPGARLVGWAQAVQQCAEVEYGFHCVRGLGGHGYGRNLHEAPFVSNVMPISRHEWPDMNWVLEPGQLLAVEPMVAVGTPETAQEPREWPIRTRDGGLAVHYEHDVLITPDGPEVLTSGLEDLPMIVGA